MSAVSKVQIANMALSHVGAASSIESLDENSPEAKACKLWYTLALEQALEGFDWSFARKRQALAVAGDAPPSEWGFRYQYPAECVRFHSMWNPLGPDADAVPFEIETDSGDQRTIVTNLQSAIGLFTKLITAPASYTPMFVEALSRSLAHHIAFTLTRDLKIKAEQAQGFQGIINAAMASNANERVGRPPRDAPWIRGRNFLPFCDPRFR